MNISSPFADVNKSIAEQIGNGWTPDDIAPYTRAIAAFGFGGAITKILGGTFQSGALVAGGLSALYDIYDNSGKIADQFGKILPDFGSSPSQPSGESRAP